MNQIRIPEEEAQPSSLRLAYRDLYELIADWQYRWWGLGNGPAQTAAISLSFVASMNVISILVVIGVTRGQSSPDEYFGPYPKVAAGLIFAFFEVLHWVTLRPSTYKKPGNQSHSRWPLLLYPFVSLAICYTLLFAFGHPYRGRAH